MKQTEPKLTALSFSGGKQSSCILWMVLRGDIQKPKNFIVVNADPGMENRDTYPYINLLEKKCKESEIPFLRTSRNLYREIMDLKKSKKKRFDTPAFYTKNRETGKIGRLNQRCTGAYKIEGMHRIVRIWMDENLGISRFSKRIGNDILCEWVGFSSDEWHRIKDDTYKRKFAFIEYPLLKLGMTKEDCENYMLKNNLPVPPPSVCNACFANSIETFKKMSQDRPEDFEQACLVDEQIRDLTCIGVRDLCYVSSTCIPLRQLKEMNFILPKEIIEKDTKNCHSGRCFL